MNRLNYFNPYDGKSDKHEDRFTRGVLALTRLSPLVATYFYSLLKAEAEDSELPATHHFNAGAMETATQRTSLPEASRYYSVILSDDVYEANDLIIPVGREARYDGVIKYGEAVFFIEVKPFKGRVWEKQLCPNAQHIPEEAYLSPKPIAISTRVVLTLLDELLENPATSATERKLIEDFRWFVNKHFPDLNPFKTYSTSLTYQLAQRRTEALLQEIANSDDLVRYHQGWGHYIDIVDQPEIRKIGLLLEKDATSETWTGLRIAADFGSTQGQAKAFYANPNVTLDQVHAIERVTVTGNLHLAKITSNVIHFATHEDRFEAYFAYWKTHGPQLRQIKRAPTEQAEGFQAFYNRLKAQQLVEGQDTTFESKVMAASYQNLNVCPSFYVTKFLSRDEVIALEADGELEATIAEVMQDILGLLGREIDIFSAHYQH